MQPAFYHIMKGLWMRLPGEQARAEGLCQTIHTVMNLACCKHDRDECLRVALKSITKCMSTSVG